MTQGKSEVVKEEVARVNVYVLGISELKWTGMGALDLRRGPQGPTLAGSGKASPHASCSGASRDSTPVDAGA